MNASNPLVSIIVPCFNYGHFLSDALDSVIRQSHQNWECVVVDDGSVDDTAEVAKRYEIVDERVRYFFQHNSGLAAARNAGLRLAKGEYIQLLDADDILPTDKIRRHLSVLLDHPDVDIVYGQVYAFDRDVSKVTEAKRILMQTPRSGVYQDVLVPLVEDNMFLVHCALFRASIVSDVGFFNESMRTCEDWNFWFRCALSGKRFLYYEDDGSKVYVRSHGHNMSANRKNMWIGKIRFHNEVERLVAAEGERKDFFKTLTTKNKQLLSVLNARFELTYGSIGKGIINSIVTLKWNGNFFGVLRDSLFWIKERLLNKV